MFDNQLVDGFRVGENSYPETFKSLSDRGLCETLFVMVSVADDWTLCYDMQKMLTFDKN